MWKRVWCFKNCFVEESNDPSLQVFEHMSFVTPPPIVVGKGGFARVCKYQDKVVKQYTTDSFLAACQEYMCLKDCDHAYIVKVFSLIATKHNVSVLLEDLGSTTLYDIIDVGNLCPLKRKHFVRQLLEALRYLHEDVNVAHLDIKPENVMVRNQSLKVIDFNLSYKYKKNEDEFTILKRCGTRSFAAPEVLEGTRHFSGYRADVWSFSVLVFCLIFSKMPFNQSSMVCSLFARFSCTQELPIDVFRGMYPSLKWDTSPEEELCINCGMIANPRKRVSISRLCLDLKLTA